MNTSPITGLSEPHGVEKISRIFGYIRARHRQRMYDVVIREFKQSGLSQADLARRLGKSPEIISRLLARPANWEADTFSDLLFAISGAVAIFRTERPLSRHERTILDDQIKTTPTPIQPVGNSAISSHVNNAFLDELRKQALTANTPLPIAA